MYCLLPASMIDLAWVGRSTDEKGSYTPASVGRSLAEGMRVNLFVRRRKVVIAWTEK
jgi:hypothetical protein